MKIYTYPLALFLAFILAIPAIGQQIAIEEWRDELPYYEVISVTDAGDRVYAATPYAIFIVDKTDNSVQRMSKINGLSDIGISCIKYNTDTKTVVLTYTNANIDLIRNNNVTNISDIKRKVILGNKTINSIYCRGKYAYLSCGFGIVVLDLEKDEVSDTYYIGTDGSPVNVLAVTSDLTDTIWAASDKGIYKASLNAANLANFTSWQKDSAMDVNGVYNYITTFGNRVFVNKAGASFNTDNVYYHEQGAWTVLNTGVPNTVTHLETSATRLIISYNYFVILIDENLQNVLQIYNYYQYGSSTPLDAVLADPQHLWIGDRYRGLLAYDITNNVFSLYDLSGPLTARAFSMAAKGDQLYIAPGGRDGSYVPLYFPAQVYHFDNVNWANLYNGSVAQMSGTHDIVTIAIDPNNANHFYAGCFGSGLFEFDNNAYVNRYGEWNSTLSHHSASDTGDIRVGGTAFDNNGNLWVNCSHTNNCISMKSGSQWYGFTIPINQENDLGAMVVDHSNQVWSIMRYGSINPYSILVFSDNGTPDNTSDDQARKLNSSAGNGAIPGNVVAAMAVDQDGEIWVGTESGICVFYSPENVFSGQNFDAQQILVKQGSYYQYLLENEAVTAIAIDGGNRKWIGTDRGGVFLFSPDGTEEIYHFTEDNSPLFSNRISSIAINGNTGEVFFGTDKGVISFKSTSTDGGQTKGDVYAYPNPVKAGYNGWIAIKGLVQDASVKITDISGNVIFSTRALGGQAIWDGNNFDGKRARSGVYLVFASDDTGNEKVVTKILFIN